MFRIWSLTLILKGMRHCKWRIFYIGSCLFFIIFAILGKSSTFLIPISATRRVDFAVERFIKLMQAINSMNTAIDAIT